MTLVKKEKKKRLHASLFWGKKWREDGTGGEKRDAIKAITAGTLYTPIQDILQYCTPLQCTSTVDSYTSKSTEPP
jgi:hypothetical protein